MVNRTVGAVNIFITVILVLGQFLKCCLCRGKQLGTKVVCALSNKVCLGTTKLCFLCSLQIYMFDLSQTGIEQKAQNWHNLSRFGADARAIRTKTFSLTTCNDIMAWPIKYFGCFRLSSIQQGDAGTLCTGI